MSKPHPQTTTSRWPLSHIALLLAFWLAIYVTSLATPALLDDADSTHAQAAQAMLTTGDWVTLHVDGVRYLEKAPLPYWLSALSIRVFGANTFATHLPLALAVLALTLLGYAWARRAFDYGTADRIANNTINRTALYTALYTALFTLTSTGVFLFTRIFIPEVLLSLFLAAALYTALQALDGPEPSAPPSPRPNSTTPTSTTNSRQSGVSFAAANDRSPFPANMNAYAFWIFLALAVLTKGLIAIVFLLGTILLYALITRQRHQLARLKPLRGVLLFLFIAAPWHILAGQRNIHGANNHGFYWFYFVNEHYLRFLGQRIPRDYNKVPAALYWLQHLVWLFPWVLFAPAALWIAHRKRRSLQASLELDAEGNRLSRLEIIQRRKPTQPAIADTFAGRTTLLLLLFSTFVLVFFSFSTNQEYYTFPIYLPLLMLLAAALTIYEQAPNTTRTMQRTITFAHAAFALIGLAIAITLAIGLYQSRTLPATTDIGTLLAHRNVGDYTLSMSHFFDITAPSLAALRLPAILAAIAFTLGPTTAWFLRTRRKHFASTLTVALTSTTFLIAAHIAFVRFAPLLSSRDFAARIQQLEQSRAIATPDEVLIYGDQSFGSSLPFYLHRPVYLVDGRTTSMQFGSTFPDAPPLFLTHQQLLATWGTGPRKILFVPAEQRDEVNHLLGPHQILLTETSGKALLTDRPLDSVK